MPKRLAILSLLSFCLVLLPLAVFAQSEDESSDSGLILNESGYDVDETVSRLIETLEDRGLTVMGTVDHAANAASVDKELLPTQVVIFGNPNLGTPLMQNSRSVAIDLPQKYLVWEDSSGRTFVTYNSVPYLADRHGLTGPEEVLTTVTGALANFAGSVAPAAAEPEAEESTAEEAAEEATAEEATAEEAAAEETAAEEAAAEEATAEEAAAEEAAAEEAAAEEATAEEAAAEEVAEDSEAVQAEPAPATLPVTGGTSSGLAVLWVVFASLLVGCSLLVMPGLRKNLAKNKIVGLLLFGLLTSLSVGLPASVQADNHSGLVANDSPYSVEDTVERLQAAMESRNLKVMMVIDHAANAAKVEKELPPTQVILFGNPNVGTDLMQANRSMAIDLPQKMLVWDDGEGNVQVIYNDPSYLATRHNISDQEQVITNVSGALDAIVTEATTEE